ncbi:MAG: metal-dependent transcriptional regulator [Desulfarculaceae bacterium]|nr:metal-dependent transcriptional regulator [Desulfarculaceae bacterium]
MKAKQKLTPSLEDYLEAIYHIIEEKQAARVKEIAKRLNVNNSSVTGALKSLSSKGYLNYSPYDVITLTEHGRALAVDVIRRHEVLKQFFTDILCIDPETADEAACKMEHEVTPEVLNKIVKFVEFTEICPRSGQEWIEGFRRFSTTGKPKEECSHVDTCRFAEGAQGGRCPAFAGEIIPLSRVKVGEKARLVQCDCENGSGRMLAEYGVTAGSLFHIDRINPETDDIELSVRGYHLVIRKVNAEKIQVSIC